MLWYIFPVKEKMSWEGHLSGFVVGIFLALLFKSHIPNSESYAWESEDYDAYQDPFLQQFDADGNFIEGEPEHSSEDIKINYSYKSED